MMVLAYSIPVFLFGILMWVPSLRNNENYVNDVAGAMYWVARMKKGDCPFYKEHFGLAIGHIFHIFLMQCFWDKENTKAYYWIMAVYTALSAVLLFMVTEIFAGTLPALMASTAFSIYIVSPRIEGNWGLFEQLLPMPLFASLLCIAATSPESGIAVFVSGAFFGYAILVKQLSLLYWPGYVLVLFGTGHSLSAQAVFIAGAVAVNTVPLIYYWLKHDAFLTYLAGMWLYLLPSALNPDKYNGYYPKIFVGPQLDDATRKRTIIRNSRSLPPMLFLSCISVLFLAVSLKFSLVHAGLLACLFASIAMVFMRGTFYPHYWLNTIPWLAVFTGIGLGEITLDFFRSETLQASHVATLFTTVFLFGDAIVADRKFYVFSKGKYEFLEKVFGRGLVDEYKTWESVGKYIRETTPPTSKILICGWTPHILMYSDRAHFTASPCMFTEDYLNIFKDEYAGAYDFMNSIYKFNGFQLIPKRKNPFRADCPEIIVFGTGNPDIAGFERLTGMRYAVEEKLGGYPLFRVDRELSGLLSLMDNPGRTDLTDPHAFESMYREVEESISREDYDTAFAKTMELLRLKPYSPELNGLMAEILIRRGKFNLLFEFSSRVLNGGTAPDTVKEEVMNKLGEAYCHLGLLEEAEGVFRNLVRINGNSTTALNNLGVVYFSQNKTHEAMECFRDVLRLDPGNEDALYNLNQLEAPECAAAR